MIDIEWCQNMGMDYVRGGVNRKGRQNMEWTEQGMVT